MSDLVQVHLADGSLYVPRAYVAAVGEEVDARGGSLDVAQAQALVEKWARPVK